MEDNEIWRTFQWENFLATGHLEDGKRKDYNIKIGPNALKF
jgi:hypothetical protein